MINGGYSNLCFESSVCVFLLFGSTGGGLYVACVFVGTINFLELGFSF